MLDFAKKYGYNIYSQNGEDGIIGEAIKRINPKKIQPMGMNIAVEFGAADGRYCSNIRHFLESSPSNWSLFMIESDKNLFKKIFDNPDTSITALCATVTEANVNELIPERTNVLSIDIDGKDYEVWKAYKGKPDIVIIEINSSLNPSVEFYNPEQGASFITMLKLGQDKGYFLLCHTGNMIFILNEHKKLFPEIDDIVTIDKFFNTNWL